MGERELLGVPWKEDVGVIRDATGQVIIAYGAHPPEQDKALRNILLAAPDLFDALHTLYSVADKMEGVSDEAWRNALWAVNDALAKAQGLGEGEG